MKKYKYLPNLEVELSNITSAGVKATENRNKTGYTPSGYKNVYDVDQNNPNKNYISWYSEEDGKTSIGTVNAIETSNFYTGYYGDNNLEIHIFPHPEIYKALLNEVGYTTVYPMIVPTNYKTPKEIIEYITNNGYNYNYGSGMPEAGGKFYPNIQLHCDNYKIDTEEDKKRRKPGYLSKKSYRQVPHNAEETQKRILHIIVINEFVGYAQKENNLSLTLGEYLSDERNIKRIKEKFSNFAITEHEYTKYIVDFLSTPGLNYKAEKSYLRYEVYKTVSRREALLGIKASTIINTVKYALAAFEINVKGESEYFEQYNINMNINVSSPEEVIKTNVDIANSLDRDAKNDKQQEEDNEKEPSGNNGEISFSFVNKDNAGGFTKALINARVLNIVEELAKDSKNNLEIFNILLQSQEINGFLKTTSKTAFDSLVKVYKILGYDYLKNHVKPTNLAALYRLFAKPGETLEKTGYIKNVVSLIENNVVQDKNSEGYITSRDYILDLLYYIVVNKNNVAVYSSNTELGLKDLTSNYTQEMDSSTPTEFILNIVFPRFEDANAGYSYGSKYYEHNIVQARELGI